MTKPYRVAANDNLKLLQDAKKLYTVAYQAKKVSNELFDSFDSLNTEFLSAGGSGAETAMEDVIAINVSSLEGMTQCTAAITNLKTVLRDIMEQAESEAMDTEISPNVVKNPNPLVEDGINLKSVPGGTA